MSWALRRQLLYLFGVFFVLGLIVFGIFYKTINVPPNCFDNKKNGTELGIDCGGICFTYCPAELSDPKIRWVRTFEITPGIVHAVAYIEHNHIEAASRKIKYSFKLYDERNSLIVERLGESFVGPMGRTAIVETLIKVEKSKPVKTIFSIIPDIKWEKISNDFSKVVIKTSNSIDQFQGGIRITANILNQSNFNFKNLDIVAIIYDKNGNAITASKSVLSRLGSNNSATVYFTWPFNIEEIDNVEIIPRFNVFNME